ncbi:hypothetical protein [Paenibacillus sp. Z3-2]
MRITNRSFYHGVALAGITEHENFTSINRISNINSLHAYQLNHDKGLYIKYTAKTGKSWRFTFTPEHQIEVTKIFKQFPMNTYLIFVCGETGVCIVDFETFESCIDLNQIESEWIEIYRPDGGSFRIRGANSEHKRSIPLNNFPKILFEKSVSGISK